MPCRSAAASPTSSWRNAPASRQRRASAECTRWKKPASSPRYVALLDPAAVDLGVTVFVQVRLVRNSGDAMAAFEAVIAHEPAVLEAYLMAGDADYLLRVVVPDVAAYERFFKETLARLDVVASSKSSFALRQAKFSTVLPVHWPAEADGGPATKNARKRPARRRRR